MLDRFSHTYRSEQSCSGFVSAQDRAQACEALNMYKRICGSLVSVALLAAPAAYSQRSTSGVGTVSGMTSGAGFAGGNVGGSNLSSGGNTTGSNLSAGGNTNGSNFGGIGNTNGSNIPLGNTNGSNLGDIVAPLSNSALGGGVNAGNFGMGGGVNAANFGSGGGVNAANFGSGGGVNAANFGSGGGINGDNLAGFFSRSGTPFTNSGIGAADFGGGAGLGAGFFSGAGSINSGFVQNPEAMEGGLGANTNLNNLNSMLGNNFSSGINPNFNNFFNGFGSNLSGINPNLNGFISNFNTGINPNFNGPVNSLNTGINPNFNGVVSHFNTGINPNFNNGFFSAFANTTGRLLNRVNPLFANSLTGNLITPGSSGIGTSGFWGNPGTIGYGAVGYGLGEPGYEPGYGTMIGDRGIFRRLNNRVVPRRPSNNGIAVWNNGANLDEYYASRGIVNWTRRPCGYGLALAPSPNRCSAYSVVIARPKVRLVHRQLHQPIYRNFQ